MVPLTSKELIPFTAANESYLEVDFRSELNDTETSRPSGVVVRIGVLPPVGGLRETNRVAGLPLKRPVEVQSCAVIAGGGINFVVKVRMVECVVCFESELE